MEKNKRICTYVDERFLGYVKDYAYEYNISMSKLIHKALSFFMRFSHIAEKTVNPQIFFTKQELKQMITHLDEDNLKNLAEISFIVSMKGKREYITKYLTQVEARNFQLSPRILLSILKFHIFGHEGQNWFKKEVQYSFARNRLTMTGTHELGMNFSIFIKHFMSKHMIIYDYFLTNDKLDDDKVALLFTKSR